MEIKKGVLVMYGDEKNLYEGNNQQEDNTMNHSETDYHTSGQDQTGDQTTGYQQTENQTTGYQQTENQATGYQQTENQATGYQQTENQTTGYQQTENQTAGYQQAENQTTGYQQTEGQAANQQNTGYQNQNYQDMNQQNMGYQNQNYQNSYYNQDMYRNNQNNYEWNAQNNQDFGKKKKKAKNKGKGAVAAACILLVGAVGGGTVYMHMSNKNTNSNSQQAHVTIASTDSTTKNNSEKVTAATAENSKTTGVVLTDASDVVSNVMPSIVAITSTTIVSSGNYGFSFFFGNQNGNNSYEQKGAGSGIIIGQTDSELLIVTNNHVVSGADSLSIQFIDDTSVEANVKGTDSKADLAVVAVPLNKIESSTLGKIKVATLGDSTKLSVGEGVIAIGNALGYGQSVTCGVVSALDREVESEDGSKTKMIQTDAAINGGNSGGALLNSEGQVIGINAAKYSSNGSSSSASIEGMGFAIPISSATDIINNLMNQKTKTKVDENKRGALGISVIDISSEESEKFNAPTGVMVSNVTENGAADKAGIKANSIITAIDGSSVTSSNELISQLEYYAVGDKVTLTVQVPGNNGYTEKKYEVTLQAKTQTQSGSQSQGSNQGQDNNQNQNQGNSFFGN